MYNRDSKIMRKLLGRTVTDAPSGDATPSAPASIPASYRPSKVQDAVYAAGVPISCFDVSPDKRMVALGGPHILKTVHVDNPATPDSTFAPTEGIDLRAIITSQASTGPKANSAADQLNIRDVKWHGNMVFTACANGRIFGYDVARLGTGGTDATENVHIQEDSRQINTLDANPHIESWLLSGGQDGVARIFDVANRIHTRQGFLTFRQRFAALRCIDSIRQVKWSPKRGDEMAACTDSGVVLKWDIRQPSKPLLRINAHEKACTGIAWHPDGNHLISAGSDSKLHVWEMGNSADRRQKPKYTISTPAPVAAVAWRPGLWSATAQGRRVAQVAVSYDDNSARRYGTSAVHIWDLARPTMPYKEIERFDSSPSALMWQDQDRLWTVGQDGLFNQCDAAYAPRAVDRQPTSAMSFSSRGDVLMFLDERPQKPRPRTSVTQTGGPRSSYGSSTNTPMLSLSRSDSEEDVVGSFLAPRRRMHHKRRPSGRTAAISTTPPSGSGLEDAKKVLGLEQAIRVTGIFKPQQSMAFGHIPSAKSVPMYQYLSSIYLEMLERELPYVEGGKSLLERVTRIMEQYARAAENASLFRLAQTWRILAFAMGLLLKRRAQYHLEKRVSSFQKIKYDIGRGSRKFEYGPGDATPRRSSMDRFGRSLMSEPGSTSNVPTPRARPADYTISHSSHPYRPHKVLTPITEPESFTIGPSIHGSYEAPGPRQRLESMPISLTSEESERSQSQVSNTGGYDFYGMEELSHAVDVPLGGDHPQRRAVRHDSNESYGQMFSISEGTRQNAKSSPTKSQSPRRPSLSHQDSKVSDVSDYHSRIRGEEIEQSPKSQKPISESPEDVFMISQTTIQSDEAYSSQPSFPSQDSESQGNGTHFHPSEPTIPETPTSTRPSPYHDPCPTIIETDYLPWPHDHSYPQPLISPGFKSPSVPPLDPHLLLTRALEFESRTSALNASAMVLLLKPLVPDSVISAHQATAILRQHHSRLSSMGLVVEAALLRNLCVQGWPAGLPTWGDSYPAIFAPAQRDIKVALACSSCHKPREIDPADASASIWLCERCRAVMAPCAVCGHREPETTSHNPIDSTSSGQQETPLLSGWWYCPGCAHGGHASCLQTWHAPDPSSSSTPDLPTKFSGGCCPLDGCGHACLPGKYRGETATSRADDLARAAVEKAQQQQGLNSGVSSPRGGAVRSDGNDVPQSRAVGMAREALSRGASNGGGSGGGILSSSPGRATTGERERRKSVKFAKPDR
ncbi:SEA (Seh1-associated) complex subunit [Amphichorda felina]